MDCVDIALLLNNLLYGKERVNFRSTDAVEALLRLRMFRSVDTHPRLRKYENRSDRINQYALKTLLSPMKMLPCSRELNRFISFMVSFTMCL